MAGPSKGVIREAEEEVEESEEDDDERLWYV